jgi:hypothetical protein
MNITSASNPIYSKSDNSTIDVEATFDNGQTYPYTAAAYDNTPHGMQLWADLNSGKYGAIAAYVPPSQ